MSAEAAGGIGIIALLIAAGPIIIAALQILLVGGAVAAAIAGATAAARGINKIAREQHLKKAREMIAAQQNSCGSLASAPSKGLSIKTIKIVLSPTHTYILLINGKRIPI